MRLEFFGNMVIRLLSSSKTECLHIKDFGEKISRKCTKAVITQHLEHVGSLPSPQLPSNAAADYQLNCLQLTLFYLNIPLLGFSSNPEGYRTAIH